MLLQCLALSLFVPDCSPNLASVPRFSQQGHDVRMNEEHTVLLLRDSNIFVPFCFESHTGYYLMPWYPPPAYATFVKLPDQLDVIDLNASVESGAYESQMSAAAHAGAASRDPISESDSSSSLESSVCPLASCPLFIALILSTLCEKHLLRLTSAMAMLVRRSLSTSILGFRWHALFSFKRCHSELSY